MASVPPDQLHPDIRIFRLAPNGRDLSEIPYPIWQQIVSHNRPLQPANGSVKVLLISGRGSGQHSQCDSIDALRLQTDDFGFLLTWDASFATSASAAPAELTNVSRSRAGGEAGRSLVDARSRFLRRYIAHRHSWQPDPILLARTLALAGYTDRKP